ncbi:MAG: hypothetical protein EVJ46_07250 [Candidatus Acididesulfobacter guangdongensis]|uniref:Glycosyltransferase family 9 protein n=1 Tax=Acididesulfobacter guangdongensis TaxID=2597225 RepID=A0A519BFE4_ACIG2|nr:MAG: hypothetical protein EVJ46_07250 [Candidatus Acididesulfobacter guangdongensis]
MGNSAVFVFQMRRIGDFFQSIPLIDGLYAKTGIKKINETAKNKEESRNKEELREKEKSEKEEEIEKKVKIDIFADINITAIKDFLIDDVKLVTFKDLFPAEDEDYIRRNDSDFFNLFDNIRYCVLPLFSRYGLAANLNYDILSGLLLDFFDNANKKGFICINKSLKTSEALLRHGAANYFYNSVKNRKLNKLNIIDIFSLIGLNKPAELKINYDILKLKFNTENKNKKNKNNRSKFRICISTGASSEKRLWSTKNYSRLAELLLKHFNCEITFIGTKEDVPAAAAIKDLLFSRLSDPDNINITDNTGNLYNKENIERKIIDITGKTSLSELIYIIKDFDLIISTDTGTLHIAQILQVPAVSIFIGNANFYETGPHLNKSYAICSKAACYPCLEHDLCRYNFSCKNDIKPEDVFSLAVMTLRKSGSARKELISNIKKGNSEVFFCANAGSIHYYPLVKKYINKNELASEILKYCWIYILSGCGVEPDIDNILKNCKKYYKISTALIEELQSDISFVITVFENGKLSFARLVGGGLANSSDSQENSSYAKYFDRFKKAVKEIGRNYGYLKLVTDYFIDEIDFYKNSGSSSDSNPYSGSGSSIDENLYADSDAGSDFIEKTFNDIVLLLDTAVDILTQLAAIDRIA